MSRFEILCVTMNQKDFSKLKQMNVHSDIVYANQCDHTSYEEQSFEGHRAKMISTQTRGVGINRNLSLCYASGEICLLSDDDVTYCDNMESRVLKEFDMHPDADIIVFHFQSNNPQRNPKQYFKTRKCSRFSRTPWGAVRIAFRLQAVQKANAWFSVLFGGGCTFPAGEDSLWLKELKRANLTFYVSDQTIGMADYGFSSWFSGMNEKYFYGIGACYAGQKEKLWLLKYLYTLIRTHRQGALTAAEKIRWIRNGKQGYQQMKGFEQFINENRLNH